MNVVLNEFIDSPQQMGFLVGTCDNVQLCIYNGAEAQVNQVSMSETHFFDELTLGLFFFILIVDEVIKVRFVMAGMFSSYNIYIYIFLYIYISFFLMAIKVGQFYGHRSWPRFARHCSAWLQSEIRGA